MTSQINGVTLDHSYDSIDQIEAVHRERLVADASFRGAVGAYLGQTLVARLGAGEWDFSEETETVGEQVVHLPGIKKPFQPQLAIARFLAFASTQGDGPGVLRDYTARWDHAHQRPELVRMLALSPRPVDLTSPPSIEGLDAARYRPVVMQLGRSIGALYAALRPGVTWQLGLDPESDSYGELLMPGWTVLKTVRKGLSNGTLEKLVTERLERLAKN